MHNSAPEAMLARIATLEKVVAAHLSETNNPHYTTAYQVGAAAREQTQVMLAARRRSLAAMGQTYRRISALIVVVLFIIGYGLATGPSASVPLGAGVGMLGLLLLWMVDSLNTTARHESQFLTRLNETL